MSKAHMQAHIICMLKVVAFILAAACQLSVYVLTYVCSCNFTVITMCMGLGCIYTHCRVILTMKQIVHEYSRFSG